MRSALLEPHYRCNQACVHCTVRRPVDEPREIRTEAVRARLRRAIEGGPDELFISGGEPTLRGDLASLVREISAAGVRPVLETNAVVIDDARAHELAEAGLTRARVHVPAWGRVYDEVTQDPGGFEAMCAGLSRLDAAGIECDAVTPVIASTVGHLRDVAEGLARLPLSRRPRWWLRVPVVARRPSEVLEYHDAFVGIEAAIEAAARVGIEVRFDPDAAPPPCCAPHTNRVAHLYSMAGAPSRTHAGTIEGCGTCLVRGSCPGVPPQYLERFGTPRHTPVTLDRSRRRLSIISTVSEQIQRELVSRDRYLDAGGHEVEEDVVRVQFQCNQECRFCFVSTHLPNPDAALVEQAIAEAGRSGRRITLSGGEPTLNPRLVDYVALARRATTQPIRLQTNAVLLGSRPRVEELVKAGLDEAFVSLHGATSATSDAVTGARGTFEKTVVGIDRLVEAGLRVVLNFVVSSPNAHELPQVVELVAARWSSATLNVSFIAPSTDVVPKDRELVPTYTEAMGSLSAALDRAKQLGVAVVGFESMCGIPFCLVPDHLERDFAMASEAYGVLSGEFVKTDACAACDETHRCHGIRRGYAQLHGTDELRPVRRGRA